MKPFKGKIENSFERIIYQKIILYFHIDSNLESYQHMIIHIVLIGLFITERIQLYKTQILYLCIITIGFLILPQPS